MTRQIGTPFGPETEQRLTQAEQDLDLRMPDPYRRFLLEFGGSKVSTTVPDTGGGYLQELFDVDDLIEWNTDARQFGFPAYIPATYLMVGHGSGGAPCIRMTGEDQGSVWWADFDKAGEYEEEEPRDEIMIRLADDFDTFLAQFE